MDIMPFYLMVFQSIPETAILIFLGLTLIGVKPRLKHVLIIALIESLASFLIRSFPLAPGINVFIQLPVLVALTAYICRLHVIYAALASFLGLVGIALTETVFNFIISTISGIPVRQALNNPMLKLLFPIPEFIFLIAIILLLRHYNLVLFDVQELKNLEQIKSYEK
jgi:hypothetical protein